MNHQKVSSSEIEITLSLGTRGDVTGGLNHHDDVSLSKEALLGKTTSGYWYHHLFFHASARNVPKKPFININGYKIPVAVSGTLTPYTVDKQYMVLELSYHVDILGSEWLQK